MLSGIPARTHMAGINLRDCEGFEVALCCIAGSGIFCSANQHRHYKSRLTVVSTDDSADSSQDGAFRPFFFDFSCGTWVEYGS